MELFSSWLYTISQAGLLLFGPQLDLSFLIRDTKETEQEDSPWGLALNFLCSYHFVLLTIST